MFKYFIRYELMSSGRKSDNKMRQKRACFDDPQFCDAACGMSGYDVMTRDLTMVIFF